MVTLVRRVAARRRVGAGGARTPSCARSPRPARGYAGRRPRPPRRRRGGGPGGRAAATACRRRGRTGLPAAARGPRAVVPGAVRGVAQPVAPRLGRQASTWSSCSPRTAAPAPRPRSPRRCGAAARSWSRARPGRWWPSTRPVAGARSCRRRDATSSRPRWSMLDYLEQVQLGPRVDAERVATALDEVAIACSPHRDLAVNPAKMLAIAMADTLPVVWGGSVLAARAARRIAESLRRVSGRSALAGDAEHLLPVLEAARARDVFDDPFADEPRDLRPMLLVLDDGVRGAAGPRVPGPAPGRGRRPRRTRGDADDRRADRGRPLRVAPAPAAATPPSTSASAWSRTDRTAGWRATRGWTTPR